MKNVLITFLCICLSIPLAYGGLLDPVSRIFEVPHFSRLSSVGAANKAVDLAGLQQGVRGQLARQLGALAPVAMRPQNQRQARQAISLIYLLGAMRVARAAPAILEAIALAPRWHGLLGDGIQPILLTGRYPAVSALISIGMPSVRAILKVLPTERSALRRKLMVQVMVGVEGRPVARFRLRRLIAKATTAAAKTDLEAALRDVPPQPHAGQK